MEWTGSTKAVFCLVAFLHLSCYYQWVVNAVPCIAQTMWITVDNKMVVYTNGVRVLGLQHDNSPGIADAVQLDASTQVVAVQGTSSGENNGVLGSSPSFVTDASWKCTFEFTPGWQEVNFDDSTWLAASECRAHGVKPWQAVLNVRPDALWILPDPGCTQPQKGKNFYCRKRLACDVPTPTPAPTPTPTPALPSTTFSTQAPTEGVRVPSCLGGAGETGPSCIVSCGGRANGDYQSCKGCQVYATCINEILHDERPCASGGFHWDDKVKRCEGKSETCLECK